jgi:hypothetical protein
MTTSERRLPREVDDPPMTLRTPQKLFLWALCHELVLSMH